MRKTALVIMLMSLFFIGAGEKTEPVYNVYYGNLHNHSVLSDGMGKPLDAYKYARDTAKLDFFSLADHAESLNVKKWGLMQVAAQKTNEDGKFVTFWGFEWSHPYHGHLTVINAATYIDAMNSTFADFLTWINSRDCVVFFNHPGRQDVKHNEFNHFQDTPSDKIVGMELFNDDRDFRRYYYNDGYYKDDGGKSYYDEANSRGWRIGAAGADDNHRANWCRKRPWRLAILAEKLTREDLYEAMKERRFYSTLDYNLELSFRCAGKEMGSVLEPGTYELEITMKDRQREVFSKVELKKNGTEIKEWKPNLKEPKLKYTFKAEQNDFFYVIVTQKDRDQAISSPIFFMKKMANE